MRPVDAYDGVPAHQLHIAQKVGICIVVAEDEPLRDGPEVILDGMVGYSLRGRPKGAIADAVRWAKAQPAPVLALDIPTGARRDHRRDDPADGQSDRHDDARASQSGTRGPGRGGVHRAAVPRGYRCPRRRLSPARRRGRSYFFRIRFVATQLVPCLEVPASSG